MPAGPQFLVEGIAMTSLVRPIARVTVILTICLLTQAASPQAGHSDRSISSDQTILPSPEMPLAREVRLRKLHLVRPDLIPYPIAYEVCC